ncbi:DUF29 domain-containing protein [Gloeothece verrucosa]|uniref:DUF29 domain-containing protein n=1 Tax=Gloeothece verrucosa (strain PCC 7822) TaxID=497965 RepID=E0UKB6_GLOV7|nr:DUF29 domain-containing protein [Gloeothece verrucosa]ADN15878.1 protein of unknown function DUF29 [Gloeothece verrucosa PCC 7822]
MVNLYERDFYAWTQEQVELLRHQQWQKLDLANLIEEIESLGRQQRQELRNRLSILMGHLLKWEYQPDKRSRSWLATIRIQRIDIKDLLEDNPSLKPFLTEAMEKAYGKSRELAVSETNLSYQTFPLECPYGFEQILDEAFYPGETDFDFE